MIHIRLGNLTMCGEIEGEIITLEEAYSADGSHFDCSKCMKILSKDERHVRQPDD